MRAVLLLPFLCVWAFPAAAQDPSAGKYVAKDGTTNAIFYGMSMGPDLWGNYGRKVWTLRADGTLLLDAPEGSFEDFIKRDLSAQEKTAAVHYSIEGDKFNISYNDGTKGTGKTQYFPDGSLKCIVAHGLFFYPIFLGLDTGLSGYWSNSFSFSNPSLKISTTAYSNYSFFGNGLFVLESGAGTVALGIQERTQDRVSGNSILTETVRQEVTHVYGGDAPSKMGKFEVQGSGLRLSYDDGKKETRLIGRLGPTKPGESTTVLIGRNLYEGTFGVFPKKAAGAAPAPAAAPPGPPAAAGLGRCTNAQFDLAIPAGWHARPEEFQGGKAFFITPAGTPADEAEGKFTLVLTSTVLASSSLHAADPAMIASLDALVSAWCKNEKVEKQGGTETFTVGGADAARLRYTLTREGVPVSIEAACAVRHANALVALTVASEAAMKRHGARARELLATAVLAGAPAPAAPPGEVQRVKAESFELDVPKAWAVKELANNGLKTLAISPPSGESEYVVQVIPTPAGAHASATEAGAIQELRTLVKQLAPSLEPMGSVETLEAGGQPAAGVVYGGRNEKNELILVKAYLTLKGSRGVVVLVVGKEARDTEYGAQVRRALESLRVK